eukprot:snap_masked-scaffold_3-processed-gene-17.28-mRNA-1 protein AED:1.00 eAED:1.00 QI:0/-1/0/0/-1/1/1/0/135
MDFYSLDNLELKIIEDIAEISSLNEEREPVIEEQRNEVSTFDGKEFKEPRKGSLKWSYLAEICLVGNYYSQSWKNPRLTKTEWKKVFRNFRRDCNLFGANDGLTRSRRSTERHLLNINMLLHTYYKIQYKHSYMP